MFNINFKNASLNADRAAVLKSFTGSEIGMVRVVTNEIIHTIDTGDFRGLRTVLMHMEARPVVFKTVRSIITATVGKSITVTTSDEGLTVKLANVEKRGYTEFMGTLVEHRDDATKGIFNEVLLASLGIVKQEPKAYDLTKAAEAFTKRAKKEGVPVTEALAAITVAFGPKAVAEVTKQLDENAPAFDENKGLAAVG